MTDSDELVRVNFVLTKQQRDWLDAQCTRLKNRSELVRELIDAARSSQV